MSVAINVRVGGRMNATALELSGQLRDMLHPPTRATVKELGPGVYEDIPVSEYFALPYFSNSRGSLIKRSPAHLLADIQDPPGSTDSQKLGVAIHSAVLEPMIFAQQFALAGPCVEELKSGKRKGLPCGNTGRSCHGNAWYCGQHTPPTDPENVTALSPDDWAACIGVRDSIRANPRLRKLLEAPGRTELTVVWDDEETGMRCKARIDRLCEAYGGIVFDLKTTTDARAEVFERKLFEYGYFRQSGFYQDGLRAHGIDTTHLVICAAEKERPYATSGFRLTDAATEAGRDEMRALMARYAECVRSGVWPAYDDKINEISLPSWAWDRLEGVSI